MTGEYSGQSRFVIVRKPGETEVRTYVQLGTLPPGTRVATESGTTATLLYVSFASVRVRLDETTEIDDAKIPTKETSWGYSTMVRVLDHEVMTTANGSDTLVVKRGRPPTDPVKRAEWDAANDRARAARGIALGDNDHDHT